MVAPFTAQQTLDRARTIMQSGRGAALPELLKLIETLSLNVCEVTISELAELIEKDAVVLAKIISVANTLAHNPGIAQLSTLSQAIHQLGYNRIRTIAVSLMLLDTAGEANPAEQREAAAHALCAGLLAQGTAESLGTHDPEFAFACTALRGFGRIIFAAISASHCREALQRIPASGEPLAYRSQFGVTPLDFTRQLLSAARLPDEVLRTLRECEPESLAGVSTTYDARLLGIVDFGSRLASLTLDARHGPDAYLSQVRGLARRFERLVPGASDLAKPALQRTDERLRSFTRCNGIRVLPTLSLTRIDWRLRQLSPTHLPPERDTLVPPAREAPGTTTPLAGPASLVATTTTSAPGDSSLLPLPAPFTAPEPLLSAPALAPSAPEPVSWDSPLTDSIAFEAQPLDPATVDPLQNALTLIRSALSAQDCWLFHSPAGATSLTFTRGLGSAATHLPAAVRLLPEERTVFGVCLQRQEVVLIHDTTESSLLPYLPAWFRQTSGAPTAFSLIPLRTPDAAAALLLVGWGTPRRVVVSPAQIALARQLLAAAHLPASAAA